MTKIKFDARRSLRWREDDDIFVDGPTEKAVQPTIERVAPAQPVVAPRPHQRPSGIAKAHPRTHPPSAWSPWRWGLAGFLVGIVFWHFIGFWDFVSQTVLPHTSKRSGNADRPAGITDGTSAPLGSKPLFFPQRTARPRLAKTPNAPADKSQEAWTATVTEDPPQSDEPSAPPLQH